jgi:predicted site-specific integrase-resolvase
MKTFIYAKPAAELARVTTDTLHNWFKAGKLKQYKDARGRKCYDRAELEALLVPKEVAV